MIYRIWETMNCTRHVGHLYAQVEFLGERMREREREAGRERASSFPFIFDDQLYIESNELQRAHVL